MRYYLLTMICVAPIMAPVKPVSEGKTLGVYRSKYKSLTEWSEKVNNVDYYKEKFTFKDKKTGETKKLNELPKFEQQIFFLMMADQLTRKLGSTYEEWQEDFSQLGKSEAKEDITDADDMVAQKQHVEKLLQRLLELRKKTAVKVEKITEEVFKTYSDKFTDQEKKLFLKKIKEYHDKNKLINRK